MCCQCKAYNEPPPEPEPFFSTPREEGGGWFDRYAHYFYPFLTQTLILNRKAATAKVGRRDVPSQLFLLRVGTALPQNPPPHPPSYPRGAVKAPSGMLGPKPMAANAITSQLGAAGAITSQELLQQSLPLTDGNHLSLVPCRRFVMIPACVFARLEVPAFVFPPFIRKVSSLKSSNL